MLVFWKQRLVILAVPKTGTSALADALGDVASMVVRDPPELKHAPLYRYNRFFRPMFEKMGAERMEIVAVVREPVSWLGSWYRYRRRDFLVGKPNSTRRIDFNEFVLGYCADKRPAFADVGSQAKFLEPRGNGISADLIFRYEAFPAFVTFLENRLNTEINLRENNVSEAIELTLGPETAERLRRTCAADYELWEAARIN